MINAVKMTTHVRFYGCSCLIVLPSFLETDKNVKPDIRVIDFANACVENDATSFDEGFVFGLENLKQILVDLNSDSR